MKSKNMTLMVVAIGCGLVAAFLTARLSGGSSPDKVEVIVAKKDLPVGTILEEKEMENLLGTIKFEKGTLPPDVIMNAEELKGKKLTRTLKQGNYFSATDVGTDSGIKIPEGMFQYAIKSDNVKAVAGFVQAGDKVDVILTETGSERQSQVGHDPPRHAGAGGRYVSPAPGRQPDCHTAGECRVDGRHFGTIADPLVRREAGRREVGSPRREKHGHHTSVPASL